MSKRYGFLLLASLAAAAAETRTLTLQQVVELALKQNPDYLLARLEEDRAREAIREARAPFVPQFAVGSGLAYSSGFPLSIEGSAPSILQAQGSQFLLNRPQSFRVREAREMAEAAGHAAGAKSEEIAYRVAGTYLDFERATRGIASASRQLETLLRIERLVEERVQAGREIPLELSRARVQTARLRTQIQQLRGNADLLEAELRADLGLGDDVRLAPVETQLGTKVRLPETEDAGVESALGRSREIQRLGAVLRSKQYQVQAEKGAYWPRIDLVAQYALLGRYNNYEDFFRTFRRHNGQLGVSFQLPLFAGRQIASRVAQAETEIAQTNLRLAAARSAAALETRRLFRAVRQAEAGRDLARLELDFARENLSVMLARFDEGRVSLQAVEEARGEEFRRWEAYYDTQTAAEKARLNLLRQTGELLAALRP
jgi:outer membrane protein TolC